MKLCKEDKLVIYDLVKSGKPYTQVSREFQVHKTVVQYLVRLLDVHGTSILEKKGKDYYPPKLKQEMINQVLIHGYSEWETAIRYGLPSKSQLSKWIVQYKKNGYTVVEKTRGRPKLMTKTTRKAKTDLEKLQEENLRLRAEVAVLKKLREHRLKEIINRELRRK